MSKTVKRCEKSMDILAGFSMGDKVNNLVKGGKSVDDAVKVVNAELFKIAFNSVVNNKVVNWLQLIDKVFVEQVDENLETTFRPLKINQVVIIKKNSKSTKILLDGKIKTLLSVFGANLLDNKLDTLGDDTLPKMKRYIKTDKKYECFICPTCISNNKLEEQFQVIINELVGENVIKVKKTYVTHLKECYIKATEEGYKVGNEGVVLQLVINHAFDAKYNVKYSITSGLEVHKEPKTKN